MFTFLSKTPFHRLRALFLPLSLLALVTVLGACSNTRELEPVELTDFEEEGELDVIWSEKISGGQGKYYHQFRLAVDSEFIYAASQSGNVYKLDKKEGDEAWEVELDEALTSGVAVDDSQVYVATESGVLVALDKENGEQKWAFPLRSELVSLPVSDNRLVYVHASNGDVYAVDAQSGEQRWRVSTNVPALSLRGNASPVIIPQVLLVGTASGKVAIIDRQTGQLFAEPKISTPEGDTEIERMVDVDGKPFFANGKLYAASFQGQLVALDLQGGKHLWEHKTSSFEDVSVDFDQVYISTDDGVIQALNADTGEVKWLQEGLLRRKTTAPVPYSSYLIVSDLDGYIHLLSQIDGHFVARKKISGSGVKSPALVDGNRFYVIANNGRLKAYRLELD